MPKIANAFPQKPLPYLALMLGILSLAMSAIFVRWADAPGPITAFYRVSISIILLTPFFLRGLKKQRALPKKIWLIPLWGGIFTALDFAFWNTAVTYTTAANSTFL